MWLKLNTLQMMEIRLRKTTSQQVFTTLIDWLTFFCVDDWCWNTIFMIIYSIIVHNKADYSIHTGKHFTQVDFSYKSIERGSIR